MPGETVLIADSDADTREILALALSRAGFRTLVAADGDQAMAMLASTPVRLMISDLYLPTGQERCLLRAIDREAKRDGLHVIAYTTRLTPADQDWARRYGCAYVLPKPTPLLTITERVRGVLDGGQESSAD
jgi:DNA-binding response OmpR family regulator